MIELFGSAPAVVQKLRTHLTDDEHAFVTRKIEGHVAAQPDARKAWVLRVRIGGAHTAHFSLDVTLVDPSRFTGDYKHQTIGGDL